MNQLWQLGANLEKEALIHNQITPILPRPEFASRARKARRMGWNLFGHLQTLAKPGLVRRWFRQTFPLPTPFFDGQSRLARRSVYRLFKLWLKAQGSTNEAWAAYDAYKGGDVIDVHAGEGFYSLLLAPKSQPGARHLCMEPNQRDYPRLMEHLGEAKRLFPQANFYVFPNAAGDGSEIAVATATGPRKFSTTRIDSLVEFLHLAPGFVKIDVEGMEWAVLEGMEQTLRNHSPVLLLEIHPAYLPKSISVEHLQNWLGHLGYKSREVDRTPYSWRQIWNKG